MEIFQPAHLLQSAQLLIFENFPACTFIPSAQLFERLEYTTVNCTTKRELMQQMFEKLTCTNSYQINDGVIIIFTFFIRHFNQILMS